ncbi:hypothetical protein F5B20DRAFT_550622 [Whalleya microplaca]|nr:hypothetical protein F5B20DRAFT_550622 [Whalleya microplaca]
MNYENLDLDYVDPNRLFPPDRPDTSTSTITQEPTTASQVTILHDPRLVDTRLEPGWAMNQGTPSPSTHPSDLPYGATPPPAPTPPSAPSEPELYGPDRLFGYQSATDENASRSLIPSPAIRIDQPQTIPMAFPQDALFMRDFKDDLTRAAGVVTPGVDDGPYIRYALDALTRSRHDSRDLSGLRSSYSDESFRPRHHFTPIAGPSRFEPPPEARLPPEVSRDDDAIPSAWNFTPSNSTSTPSPLTAEEELQARRMRREELRKLFPGDPQMYEGWKMDTLQRDRILRPSSPDVVERPPERTLPRNAEHWVAQPDTFADLEKAQHPHRAPPLTFKPWILRSQSLLLFMTLCILMIAALIFCAVYSASHHGFTKYAGTIYGGQYFLFRILPQLLAAVMLIYAQCVVTAAFRVLPFSMMASDDRQQRRNTVFLPLYPKSFLWPQLVGSWNIWIPIFNVWLLNFTVPLQSSLFTVILVDGTWTWATVQGVAWTLVALYVSLLLSLVVVFVTWRHRRTGMMRGWDLRTLADIIFLVSQSNSLPQYRGLEKTAKRRKMRRNLSGTAERLGYWFAPEAPENETWYGIGVPTSEHDLEVEKMDNEDWANRRQEGAPSVASSEAGDPPSALSIRGRYLPWCFRDNQLVIFTVACTLLLIALFAVSFAHPTDVRNGFLPGVSSGPTAGAFSPADFLYSFVPSLIGMIFFLLFQSLDLTLRILTPWGELARPEGSRAEKSLLLDYPACLPFQVTYKALRNRHWRVAFVSLLSTLLILVPVLAGGIFLALTTPSGIVRMFPNIPTFAIVLSLLILYVLALIALIPARKQFRLPHAVTCPAEVLSFCCNEQLRTDAAFDFDRVGEHAELRAQLDAGRDWHRQGRWTFGSGRNDDERLGIKRLSRYTVNPKRLRAYDQRVRGGGGRLGSAEAAGSASVEEGGKPRSPLPYGSRELFGRC